MYSVGLGLAVLYFLVPAVAALPVQHFSKRDNTGDGTYYDTGTGACGYTDSNNDPIVAISHVIYGDGESCNQWVQITNPANGKSQYGQVRDECEGCAQDDLDMSPSLFQSLGEDLSVGRFQIEWHYMDKDWSPSR
ncbi:RlpA-like double-psi beta-barrel-protein domain-containing protein-containing protein [Fomitopsis betulina]|nr:RlpA-like double-psi beta-barrel-protein domain-containing protein-containing protein [Fomitopsis betulina]